LLQVKAEAAAAASFKAELERQVESLRRQLRDMQEGTALPSAPSTGADGAEGTTSASAARDAALVAAELRTTQVQLQHVMHERKAAQNLAEQHKSSAESLERHRDALHKTISELRAAKEVRLHTAPHCLAFLHSSPPCFYSFPCVLFLLFERIPNRAEQHSRWHCQPSLNRVGMMHIISLQEVG
jgi:Tfp pilus assembly protein FimV